MGRRLILGGVAALLLSAVEAQAQPACPRPQSAPQVSVEVTDAGVLHDFTRTGQDMMAMADTPPPPGMVMRGLTEATVEVRMSVQVSALGDCAWPSLVRVQVGFFRPQKVFVERNYTPGTCQHQVILAHEELHVRINRDSVSEMAGTLRDGLGRAVSSPGYPVRFSDPAWVQGAIVRSLRDYVDSVSSHFAEVRRARHAIIDTPENYRATSALCTGW